MKNNMFPSAEMVGLNSGRSELILIPRFSIFRIVLLVMTLSFWYLRPAVSGGVGCAYAVTHAGINRRVRKLFTVIGFANKISRKP